MNTLEISESDAPQAMPAGASATGHPIGKLAGVIDRADPGTRAALARLDPEDMRPHQIAALCRSLIEADMSPDTWHSGSWKRWALVANGMALAGHDGTGRLGTQFATAGVSEPRVTKLLVSRGDAFLQIVPRLLRLLAGKQVKPNWYTLSELIHKNDAQGQAHEAAEALRLRIAGDYFSAVGRTS